MFLMTMYILVVNARPTKLFYYYIQNCSLLLSKCLLFITSFSWPSVILRILPKTFLLNITKVHFFFPETANFLNKYLIIINKCFDIHFKEMIKIVKSYLCFPSCHIADPTIDNIFIVILLSVPQQFTCVAGCRVYKHWQPEDRTSRPLTSPLTMKAVIALAVLVALAQSEDCPEPAIAECAVDTDIT